MNIKGLFGKIANREKEKLFLDENIIEKRDITSMKIENMWNKVFTEEMKTDEVRKAEAKLNEIFIYEEKLELELKQLPGEKKKYTTEILNLTPYKLKKNNDDANKKIDECSRKINEINAKMDKINEELMGDVRHKKEIANNELLEACVKLAYKSINNDREEAKKIAQKIEDTKEQLNVLIGEKNKKEQEADALYQYIHNIIGPERMEQLDKKQLKN